ncbi:MAG: hypothetical protein ACW99A_14130, partial [Candidatus Kariarchaeaceae archaeon]
DSNIKMALLSFLGSVSLFLFIESSKIWSATGWKITMVSYRAELTEIEGIDYISTVTNFKVSTLGIILVILSMFLFIIGIWLLYTEIKFQPNSIFTIIPYAVLAFVLILDSLFSEIPTDIRLLNTTLILGWVLIIIAYTIGYAMIPNSILNRRITNEVSFKPNIMSRISDKKLETQVLDAIEENEIIKIIEISSFLSAPYHKVLKCVKSLIIQGYLQGRILKQQFVRVEALSTFEIEYHLPEFPSPYEIWKLTMINEGVISVNDLANIMSFNSKDLDQVLLGWKETDIKFDYYLDGYLYIKMIDELDDLHNKILEGLASIHQSKENSSIKPEN